MQPFEIEAWLASPIVHFELRFVQQGKAAAAPPPPNLGKVLGIPLDPLRPRNHMPKAMISHHGHLDRYYCVLLLKYISSTEEVIIGRFPRNPTKPPALIPTS